MSEVEAALKALDEALYEVSGGLIFRGGALTASPSEEVRRRIRVFKRLEAMHGDAVAQAWDDEADAEVFRWALAGERGENDLDRFIESRHKKRDLLYTPPTCR